MTNSEGSWISATVDSFANAINRESVSPGDLATLRRYRPGDAGGAEFWKIAVQFMPEDRLPNSDDTEIRWAAIFSGMAASPNPKSRKRLGQALAEQDVTEHRVLRLLRASGEPLLRTVRTVVHQLTSNGAAFSWNDMAQIILSDGHPEWSRKIRRSIARDYYGNSR